MASKNKNQTYVCNCDKHCKGDKIVSRATWFAHAQFRTQQQLLPVFDFAIASSSKIPTHVEQKQYTSPPSKKIRLGKDFLSADGLGKTVTESANGELIRDIVMNPLGVSDPHVHQNGEELDIPSDSH
ncbi:hypothetical protein K439DRAFT_1636485 [Ramaria rubella]|nr:hypothetical protein K439DRAFT_1636485 [Ramaria rubella]